MGDGAADGAGKRESGVEPDARQFGGLLLGGSGGRLLGGGSNGSGHYGRIFSISFKNIFKRDDNKRKRGESKKSCNGRRGRPGGVGGRKDLFGLQERFIRSRLLFALPSLVCHGLRPSPTASHFGCERSCDPVYVFHWIAIWRAGIGFICKTDSRSIRGSL